METDWIWTFRGPFEDRLATFAHGIAAHNQSQERLRMRAVLRLQTLLLLGLLAVVFCVMSCSSLFEPEVFWKHFLQWSLSEPHLETPVFRKGMRARQELSHLRIQNDEATELFRWHGWNWVVLPDVLRNVSFCLFAGVWWVPKISSPQNCLEERWNENRLHFLESLVGNYTFSQNDWPPKKCKKKSPGWAPPKAALGRWGPCQFNREFVGSRRSNVCSIEKTSVIRQWSQWCQRFSKCSNMFHAKSR